MNTIHARPQLRFHSRPAKHRYSIILMSLILILGWTVMPLLLTLTYFSVERDLAAGFAAILLAFAILVGLAIGTRQFLKYTTADGYELLIHNDIVFLFGLDKKENKRLWREVPLSSVNEAAYYPLSDSSTIVLHTEGKPDLELPLWAFGKQAEKKVVDYLRTRIQVVDIPSAIVI